MGTMPGTDIDEGILKQDERTGNRTENQECGRDKD